LSKGLWCVSYDGQYVFINTSVDGLWEGANFTELDHNKNKQ